ncbi:MAG: FAD-dependent oxidoreductase, partial [Phycisphaeraceae bacterium]
MAQDNHSFDLIVIGGGPGGYVAAIRAAQLGMSVACVERDALGGVCLNWGCIPTKALLAGAELYHRMAHQRDEWGITCDNLGFDWEKVIGRSRGVAGQLNKGVGFLFKKHKIKHMEGHAFIPEKGKVEVYAKDDVQREGDVQQTLTAEHIIIATGARPRPLPGVEFDGEKVISSKQAMTLKDKPDKLLIVGAGAIGMEFAYFYNAFDTEVTVVEMV